MSPHSWQPAASFTYLRHRAALYQHLRSFFQQRRVMEVETPLLAETCAPENGIQPFVTHYHGPNPREMYLQASPELAMKRLLAAGSGPIYQLTKGFRDAESGRWHNPEFSLLEWYRPNFDHHALMDEMDELLQEVLGSLVAERLSYCDIFRLETDLDPLTCSLADLRARVARWTGRNAAESLERDECLQLILSHEIEPGLGRGCPTFIYDYPASQAALARRSPDNPALAERFEVYVEGVELANGFHELSDPGEQRSRFQAELARRRQRGEITPPLDEHFLAALAAGLPDCSGVALGVDRLLMLQTGVDHIHRVLAFPLDGS